jgi:peroxin-2
MRILTSTAATGTMSPPSWQEAWDKAQPRLAFIRDTLNSNSSPDPRVIRVGQLDSELLDQELVHLLQEPLNKALALFNVRELHE